jgi:hypothetical protein
VRLQRGAVDAVRGAVVLPQQVVVAVSSEAHAGARRLLGGGRRRQRQGNVRHHDRAGRRRRMVLRERGRGEQEAASREVGCAHPSLLCAITGSRWRCTCLQHGNDLLRCHRNDASLD